MSVPSTMADLSVTASSNPPAGTEAPSNADDFLRAIQAILRTTNAKGNDIASATTTDIGAATAEFVDVTGTTTITGLGTVAAGIKRAVRFTGALTLTHNATSLILPGSANITTANGDVALFRSLGSGNWLCESYVRKNGYGILDRAGADIASAATVDLTAATGNIIHITGTTAITAFTMNAGQKVTCIIDSAGLVLTQGTDLQLPEQTNIYSSAADRFEIVADSTLVRRVVSYVRSGSKTIMGSFTRDISLASGTQSVTGLAGRVKTVQFIQARTDTGAPQYSIGWDNGTTKFCQFDNSNVSATVNSVSSGHSIISIGTGGNEYRGLVSAIGNDSFTITWTKTGTPSGTITVFYKAEL
jgi:hypothetical protein